MLATFSSGVSALKDDTSFPGEKFLSVRPLPKGSVHVDWALVLSELQSEKKRAIARKEQQYSNRSLFFFSSSSKIREILIKVVEWPIFDRLVLLLICVNCIFLILDDPICRCDKLGPDGRCVSEAEMYKRMLFATHKCDMWPQTDAFLGVSEYVFTALFTAELLLKIIARGLILHKHAFLRDSINWLDFIVVSTSLFSIGDANTSFGFLRTVRVLRPLRTLTRIKQMRPLIDTFIRSLSSLVNVVMLLAFFMLVYGILGIELLSGALRGRCYFDPKANTFPPMVEARLFSQQVPYLVESGVIIGGWNPDVSICSLEQGDTACDPQAIDGVHYNTTCSTKLWCDTDWCQNKWNPNPYAFGGGMMSYDDFGSAILTIFQVLTNEGWVDIMYSYEDGTNVWGSRIFHVSWVLLGSFFVMQLALAVLSHSFVQAQEDEKTAIEREALHVEAILQVPPTFVREQGSFAHHQKNKFEPHSHGILSFGIIGKDVGSSRDNSNVSISMADRVKFTYIFLTRIKNPHLLVVKEYFQQAFHRLQTMCRMIVRSTNFESTIMLAIFLNAVCLAIDFHDQDVYEQSICRRRCDLDPSMPASAKCMGPLFNRTFSPDGEGGGERLPQIGNNFCFMDYHEAVPLSHVCANETTSESCWSAHPDCRWFDGHHNQPCKSGIYNYSTLASEGGSTLSLRHICGDDLAQCITYPPQLDMVISYANQVLTFVFIGEMTLKIVGLGVKEYFADHYNFFDFFVVVSSIVELVVESFAADSGRGGGSKLSALRGMRLFRLFKLARSWKSMRKILATMGIALGSLWPLTIVWVMFMYIFGLFGMQTVGARLKYFKTDTPRSNFDQFFPSDVGHGAFVVTFQIITTENWNIILYNCIQTVGIVSALFPIAIVIFGNYIIMNLFISILLQGFDEDDDSGGDGVEALQEMSTMDRFRRMLVCIPSLGHVYNAICLMSFSLLPSPRGLVL